MANVIITPLSTVYHEEKSKNLKIVREKDIHCSIVFGNENFETVSTPDGNNYDLSYSINIHRLKEFHSTPFEN